MFAPRRRPIRLELRLVIAWRVHSGLVPCHVAAFTVQYSTRSALRGAALGAGQQGRSDGIFGRYTALCTCLESRSLRLRDQALKGAHSAQSMLQAVAVRRRRRRTLTCNFALTLHPLPCSRTNTTQDRITAIKAVANSDLHTTSTAARAPNLAALQSPTNRTDQTSA